MVGCQTSGSAPFMRGEMVDNPETVATAIRDIKSGKIPEGSKVICTLTGNGLKDPDAAIEQCTTPMITVDATMDAVKNAILDNMD